MFPAETLRLRIMTFTFLICDMFFLETWVLGTFLYLEVSKLNETYKAYYHNYGYYVCLQNHSLLHQIVTVTTV